MKFGFAVSVVFSGNPFQFVEEDHSAENLERLDSYRKKPANTREFKRS